MKLLVLATALTAAAASQTPQSSAPAQGGNTSGTASSRAADALAAMHRTCAADFKAKCPGMGPGSPELRACVQERFDQLSPPCQSAIQEAVGAGAGG